MPFVFGLGFLGAATLSFALGKTVPILLIARLLQGLSSAVVFTFGSALLLDRVGKERIGRAMGFTGTAMSAGLLLGPVVGGVLYEYGGYFTVFLPALGLIVAEIILRLLMIEEKRSSFTETIVAPSCPEAEQADRAGALNDAFPVSERDPQSEIPDEDLEIRSQTEDEMQSLLPVTYPRSNTYLVLLCSPRFMVAVGGLFILNSIANGFDAVLPPYALDSFDIRPTQLALLFLTMGVPMFLAPVSGALTDKCGAKWPATAGLVLLIPSLFSLRLITPGVVWPFLKLMVLLGGVGISLAFAIPPLQTEVSAAVGDLESKQPGVFGSCGAYLQAYGLMTSAFAAGSMIGPLATGFLRVISGWSTVTLVMAILAATILTLVLCLTGGHSLRRQMSSTA